MKNMQSFYDWLILKSGKTDGINRRLAGLRLFSPSRINSVASFDPWYLWGAEASPTEA